MAEKQKKLDAAARLALLFDDGVYTELDAADASGARAGYGSVCGATVFAYAEGEKDGAFGASSARKLCKVYDLAEKTGAPVVAIYDSQGVRLADGFDTLGACSELLGRSARISGVVPQIAVVAGTCGGFASLCATMADVCLMKQDAELFLTAPFVDAAKGGKGCAADGDFAQKAGSAAVVCEDENELFAKARHLLQMLPLNNLAPAPICEFDAPEKTCDACAVLGSIDGGSGVELFAHKGNSVRTCIATMGGTTVGVAEVSGRLCRGDSAKYARLVQLCDAFSIPVVSFVDSEGFLASAENDANGGIRNAALLSHTLAEATTAKLTVITGSAIGSAYAVLCGKNAGCDMCYAWPTATVSALAPKTAVGVLWEDRIEKESDIETLAAQYAAEEASAEKALAAGVVDRIITPAETRTVLIEAIDMLASKRVSRLNKKHGNLPY